MFATAFVIAAVALPQVFAHGGVLSYDIGTTHYQGFAPYNTPTGQVTIQRPWSSYNPIQGATSSTMACNDDGTALASGAQLTATVSAGTAIKAYWNQVWPHPYGPQLTYLAKCPGTSCDGVSASSLSWFKIDQAGLLSGTVGAGSWGAGQMINQNSTWTSTIPASVPSGAYLIRFETIALHSMPAQFYPECAQLNIVNGGSLAPTSSELVKFPGAYSDNDPGLNIDLYTNDAKTQTTYVIPGPPLYAGATGGSSPAPSSSKSSSSSTITSKPTSTSTVSSTKPTSTSSSGSSGGAAHYAQCGGQGFSGPTTCVAPYTCTASSVYYSQCL